LGRNPVTSVVGNRNPITSVVANRNFITSIVANRNPITSVIANKSCNKCCSKQSSYNKCCSKHRNKFFSVPVPLKYIKYWPVKKFCIPGSLLKKKQAETQLVLSEETIGGTGVRLEASPQRPLSCLS
jgi:hypothetical protein